MRVVVRRRAGDVMYVVADPGWITGQSYMICRRADDARHHGASPRARRCSRAPGRFASIIERYGVQIFKAGVTFLKTVMTDPQNVADVQALRPRLAARRHVLRRADVAARAAVRHGAGDALVHQLVLGHRARRHRLDAFLRQRRFPAARRRAHLSAAVGHRRRLGAGQRAGCGDGPRRRARRPTIGEKGEIVIAAPYPYLCRTIWGDAEHFHVEGTRVARRGTATSIAIAKTYWTRWQDTLRLHAGRLRGEVCRRRLLAARPLRRRHQRLGPSHRHRGDRGRDPARQAGQPGFAGRQRDRGRRAASRRRASRRWPS